MKNLSTEIIALCDYALMDNTNKPSLLGIFTELFVQEFPGGLPRVYFFATLSGNSNSLHELTLKASGSSKENIFPEVKLPAQLGPNGRGNIVVTINNFVFKEAGEYEFSLYEKNKKVGSTVVEVHQTKQQEKVTN